MSQPKALFLADVIKADPASKTHHYEAAAELRRLHDETLMLEGGYESACKILSEQDKKLAELEAVNQELLAALNNIEVSTHDAMTAALARAAIAKAERNKP